ncbi:metallophosphoesterase [Vibrio alginolyticus]
MPVLCLFDRMLTNTIFMIASSDIPVHTHFKQNKHGRDLFVGDIHGNFSLLIHALKHLHFDKYKDRLFSVGDLTDRGEDSLHCLNLAKEKWFFPVLGNHECFILERYDTDSYTRNTWMRNGGEWWLSLNHAEQEAARETITSHYSLTLTVKVGDLRIGVVHAECPFARWPPEAPIDKESLKTMLWGRDDILRSTGTHINNVDFVISGHTPLDSPKIKRNKIFIDTGCGYSANNFIPDPRLSLCEFHPGSIDIHSINMHDEKRIQFEII